jgi:DNA-directed RNA polymerase III subunit RPC6
VSSVDSDDLDNGTISLKPQSSAAINLANPFFSDTGRQTLIDLSDQAVLYRAMARLTISLGQTQAPCGTCPQFNFCEEGGPVNADSCSYFTDWLSGTGGGWTADVKAEKAKKAAEEEKARRRAIAAANGETYVEEPVANGEEVYEEGEEYDNYDAPMDEREEGYY